MKIYKICNVLDFVKQNQNVDFAKICEVLEESFPSFEASEIEMSSVSEASTVSPAETLDVIVASTKHPKEGWYWFDERKKGMVHFTKNFPPTLYFEAKEDFSGLHVMESKLLIPVIFRTNLNEVIHIAMEYNPEIPILVSYKPGDYCEFLSTGKKKKPIKKVASAKISRCDELL